MNQRKRLDIEDKIGWKNHKCCQNRLSFVSKSQAKERMWSVCVCEKNRLKWLLKTLVFGDYARRLWQSVIVAAHKCQSRTVYWVFCSVTRILGLRRLWHATMEICHSREASATMTYCHSRGVNVARFGWQCRTVLRPFCPVCKIKLDVWFLARMTCDYDILS